jgi:tyrosine-protein kinase Etk/Wzc
MPTTPSPDSPNAWPEYSDSALLRREAPPIDIGTSAERGAGARKLLDIVLRGRWLILGVLILFVVPTSIFMAIVPSRYQAYSLVRIDPPVTPTASSLFAQAGSVPGAGIRFLSNEILVLNQSLFLAEETAARFLDVTRDSIRTTVPGAGPTPTTSMRDLALRLQNGRLRTTPEGRGGVDVVRISATSTIPEEAAAIANAHAEAYISRTQKRSRESATASREFLDDQKRQREAELARWEERIREFMVREGAILEPEQEASIVLSQLAQLEGERDRVTVEVERTEASLAAIERRLEEAEPILAERLTSDVLQQIRALQTRRAELQLLLGEYYARRPELERTPTAELAGSAETAQIAQLRSQVADLTSRIEALGPEYVSQVLETQGLDASSQGGELSTVASLQLNAANGRIELSGLRASLGAIQSRIRSYEAQADELPNQVLELAQLQRGRQLAEETYRAVEQKLQELRIAEEAELGYAEILRPALTPDSPFWPNRYRNIILSIILGLGCGFGGAILMTWLDNRVSRPEDLRELGQTVIGVIPDMTRIVQDDFDGAETVEVDGRRIDTRLLTLLNPLSTTSEAYRGLRTSVQFSRPDVMVQVIVLTSPAPSEGKSVTASNLAYVMAQAGRRTLLVDADLRKPSIHKKFGLPREPGLRDLLFQNDDDFDFDRHSVGIENLWVVPSGGVIPNPSELVSSKRMREFLHIARSQFDIVILDAPPVLPATDAVLLSTQSDATIMVVAAGRSRRHEIELTLEALNSVGAPMIGAVLNQFDVSQSYAYKYRYKYRYTDAYVSAPPAGKA